MFDVNPFFSIVIPAFNRAYLIGKTLESVLRQEYTFFEVLIIDDGSSDKTDEVVNEFKDPRIQYYRKENGERGAARNFGVAKAKGNYINFFDSDDLMYSNHLSTASEFISQNQDPEFFHLGYDCKLPDGNLICEVNNFSHKTAATILFDNKLSCNGVFLRKDIAEEFPFHEDRELASSEDWELWIRLICRFPLRFSNTITSSVISHDQRSLRAIEAAKVEARDLLLIEKLHADTEVLKRYGRSFNRFMAERYTFFMLCFSENKNRSRVFSWALKAYKTYPLIIFTKRFLASLKNTVFV